VNGCHLIVNHLFSLTTVSKLVLVHLTHRAPSIEGLRAPKEEHMSSNASYVKFALLMLLLIAVAMFVGVDPWGPG
jgi:hypothetical protein